MSAQIFAAALVLGALALVYVWSLMIEQYLALRAMCRAQREREERLCACALRARISGVVSVEAHRSTMSIVGCLPHPRGGPVTYVTLDELMPHVVVVAGEEDA